MPLIYKRRDSSQKLTPREYDAENELQAFLAGNPCLVMADGEPDTALVARELNLRTAGNLNLSTAMDGQLQSRPNWFATDRSEGNL
ncbi:MAG: hypothetical protein ACM3WU_10670 [Bacillota bacterium]